MQQQHSTSIKTMEAVDTTEETLIIASEEDAVRNAEEIGKVAEVSGVTVI